MSIAEPIEDERVQDIDLDSFVAHCHRFARGSSRALCGVPRAEQAKHGGPEHPLSDPCQYCGLKLCPRCKTAYDTIMNRRKNA